MHPWLEFGPRLATWLGAFFGGVALALIPVVVLRRKEPSSTIAWILTLVFFPALGAVLFLLFGRDRVRWPAKRKRQADAIVHGTVLAHTSGGGSQLGVLSTELNDLEKQIFRIGKLLTG